MNVRGFVKDQGDAAAPGLDQVNAAEEIGNDRIAEPGQGPNATRAGSFSSGMCYSWALRPEARSHGLRLEARSHVRRSASLPPLRQRVVSGLAGADEIDLAGEVAEVAFGGGLGLPDRELCDLAQLNIAKSSVLDI
jgi:hypothetical protein